MFDWCMPSLHDFKLAVTSIMMHNAHFIRRSIKTCAEICSHGAYAQALKGNVPTHMRNDLEIAYMSLPTWNCRDCKGNQLLCVLTSPFKVRFEV